MLLIDVNILLLSYRNEIPGADGIADWLTAVARGSEAFSLPDTVWTGFVRIVTNRRVFENPATVSEALDFVQSLRGRPNHVRLVPGRGHWQVFDGLCRGTGVRGNLVPDAYLAALAIETGSELITSDRGFGRYPGLRWRHPLVA